MRWRLITDLICLFPQETDLKKVYLAAPDKKSYKAGVTRRIGGTYSDLYLESNNFELKLDYSKSDLIKTGLAVYIKSETLPEPSEWYRVGNFYGDLIPNLITSLNCKKGEFEGLRFEAIFSDDFPDQVSFTTPDMPDYNECLEEMRRRLNCELHSKTKLFKAGHRYDTLTDTYYYLGTVKSRKEDWKSSDLISPDKAPTVHLVVRNVNPSEKTIGDVLGRRVIGAGKDDIQILPTLSSMVDCGEVLEKTWENNEIPYESYLPGLLDRVIKETEKTTDFGYVTYPNFKQIMDTFSLFSQEHPNLPTELEGKPVREIIDKVLRYSMFNCILENWNLRRLRADYQIGTHKTKEENAETLVKVFLAFGFIDPNVLKYSYYTSLFNGLDVNLLSIAKELMEGWDECDIYGDFDSYLKYLSYTGQRDNNKMYFDQRQSVKHPNLIKDFFSGESVLKNIICSLYESAKKNYGVGVKSFKVYNNGTKAKPQESIHCLINLFDVLNYAKRKRIDLQILKDEILEYKFYQLTILAEKNKDLI